MFAMRMLESRAYCILNWVCGHEGGMRQGLASFCVVQNDMHVTWYIWYIPEARDPLQLRLPRGNFTNGKQMHHTFQLLSLSMCKAACCFLFFFFNDD